VLRGALASVFATFVAAFSHVAGGGTMPSAAAVALSLALSLLVCTAVAGRRLSLWRTVVGVVASQSMFHLLFSGLSSSGTLALSDHAGHGTGAAGLSLMPGMPTEPTAGHSWLMWLAHAGAALLTVLALRHAERAQQGLLATARLLVGVLRRFALPLILGRAPRAPRVGCSRRVLHRDLSMLFSALRHRGPPVGCAS
jgi:hypothetical protein